jgi:hypothetical protein
MQKALVFSSYMNAFAIYIGAASLGVKVVTTDRSATFPMPARVGGTKAEWLFFTEEGSLRRALTGQLEGNFLPREFPLELLDDKWAMAQWLSGKPGLTRGLLQWRFADRDQVNYPCLLKARHSWAGAEKLPRGWVCQSAHELDDRIGLLAAGGYNSEHFFIQEWLGDSQSRVISACGFHDSRNRRRNLVALVERIASHTQGLSCSAAVKTIDDEWELRGKTADILDALDFTGPYELEYLVVGERVLVLELNPRFWMQHAIFLKDGNGLIKRYLGMDTEQDHGHPSLMQLVWIDGIHLVMSLLRFKVDFIAFTIIQKFRTSQKVMIWPSLPVAVLVVARMAWGKLQEKLSDLRFGACNAFR